LNLKSWKKRGMRWIRIAVIVVLFFVILLAVGAGVISWQGNEEWKATQSELKAKGEQLTLPELLPPHPADDENFFGAPLWKEIVEKRPKPLAQGYSMFEPIVPKEKQRLGIFNLPIPAEEVAALKQAWPRFADLDFSQSRLALLRRLATEFKKHDEAWRNDYAGFTFAALKPLDPILEEIKQLLQRPAARYPIDHAEGIDQSLPHLTKLLYLSQTFLAKARAEIQQKQGEAAMRNVLTVLALSRTLQADPLLISYLVRVSVLGIALAEINEGIVAHVWSDEELMALADALRHEDVLPGLLYAHRGERAGFNRTMESYHHGGYEAGEQMQRVVDEMTGKEEENPWTTKLESLAMRFIYIPIWSRFDQASQNRLVQGMIDATKKHSWLGMNTDPAYQSPPEFDRTVYALTHRFTVRAFPPTAGVAEKGALAQDKLVQARLAIALERYYLAKNDYPETLDSLVPAYLEELPMEALTGKPMHYERTKLGNFLLWADGWDGRDDGGRAVKPGEHDGDWVWGK